MCVCVCVCELFCLITLTYAYLHKSHCMFYSLFLSHTLSLSLPYILTHCTLSLLHAHQYSSQLKQKMLDDMRFEQMMLEMRFAFCVTDLSFPILLPPPLVSQVLQECKNVFFSKPLVNYPVHSTVGFMPPW